MIPSFLLAEGLKAKFICRQTGEFGFQPKHSMELLSPRALP